MSIHRWMKSVTLGAAAIAAALTFAPEVAKADPPSWAPAHGWQAKHAGRDHDTRYDYRYDRDHRNHRGDKIIVIRDGERTVYKPVKKQKRYNGYKKYDRVVYRDRVVYSEPPRRVYRSGERVSYQTCDGTGGALIGAGLGGLAGSQFGKGDGQLVGVATGVLIGAVLGESVATDHCR